VSLCVSCAASVIMTWSKMVPPHHASTHEGRSPPPTPGLKITTSPRRLEVQDLLPNGAIERDTTAATPAQEVAHAKRNKRIAAVLTADYHITPVKLSEEPQHQDEPTATPCPLAIHKRHPDIDQQPSLRLLAWTTTAMRPTKLLTKPLGVRFRCRCRNLHARP
jgi:hypothetical protein